MQVRIQQGGFDPWRELAAYQDAQVSLVGKHGATGVFVGTMRDMNASRRVSSMTLEHYPGMTEKHLNKISHEAHQRWRLLDSMLIHRVGPIQPDEPIVLVAVWSVHRHDALEACRYIIDELKTRAPFWKQEKTEAGLFWVEPGDSDT